MSEATEREVEDAAQAEPGDDRGRSPRSFALGVVAAAVLAAVVRVTVVLNRPACGGGPRTASCFGGFNDAAFYHDQANLMADGHWFQLTNQVPGGPALVPTALHPPLYSLYLSVASRLGWTGWDAHRMATIPLGVALVVVVALLARRVGGGRAGVIAAVAAAVYPLFWIHDTIVMSESLFALLVAIVALVAYRWWDHPGLWWAVLAGVAVGLAALTRAEGLALLAIVVAPVVVGRPGIALRTRLVHAGAAAFAALVVLAPWTAYNAVRFEEPLAGATGRVFQQAQCDPTYYGETTGYWAICTASGVPPDRDESQVDPLLFDQARDYLFDNIGRWPVVVAAREARLANLYHPTQQVRFNQVFEDRGQRASEVERWAFYAVAVLGVAGFVSLWRRRVPLSPLLGLVGVSVVATALLASGVTRYRAPADVALVVGASVALSVLVEWWHGARADRSRDDRARERGPAGRAWSKRSRGGSADQAVDEDGHLVGGGRAPGT